MYRIKKKKKLFTLKVFSSYIMYGVLYLSYVNLNKW